MQLKRVKVRKSKSGVKVMGFAYAARGGERLIGFIECKPGDVAAALARPEIQKKIGLDLAPATRVRRNLEDIA